MTDKIRTQVEYYLSDKNLLQDEVFHTQLSQAGQIPLNMILKCNKIKQLGVTGEQQLVDAIDGKSQEIELNEAKNAIKRKDQKPLPEFTGERDPNKKVKLNNQEPQEEQKKVDNPYKNFEPIIFTVRAPEGVTVSWSQITEGLMKQFNISAPYVRYGKTEGNFALSRPRTPPENLQRLTTEGVKIGEHVLTITVTDGKELEEFWAHHGKHYEGILKRLKESFEGGGGKKDKKEKRTRAQEITFHNQKYRDVSQLKNIFKTILARSENGAPLKEPYHSMLMELLQFHDKKEKKLENLKHFTVGTHPEHKETRCFMIVRNDDSVEDFSAIKCIKNLEEELTGKQ